MHHFRSNYLVLLCSTFICLWFIYFASTLYPVSTSIFCLVLVYLISPSFSGCRCFIRHIFPPRFASSFFLTPHVGCLTLLFCWNACFHIHQYCPLRTNISTAPLDYHQDCPPRTIISTVPSGLSDSFANVLVFLTHLLVTSCCSWGTQSYSRHSQFTGMARRKQLISTSGC